MIEITAEERMCAIERSRRKFQTDMQSNLATAEDRGIQKGERKRNIEIARNALQMGLQMEDIVKLTGLTLEEVERLRMTGM